MNRARLSSNPHNMGPPKRGVWLNPRRIGLGALAVISIVTSPATVVYEFVLGIGLVVAGYVARLLRPDPAVGATVRAVGMALLAGPVAYTIAWLLAELFNW